MLLLLLVLLCTLALAMSFNENKCFTFHQQYYSSHCIAPLRSLSHSTVVVTMHKHPHIKMKHCNAKYDPYYNIQNEYDFAVCIKTFVYRCIIFDPLLTCFQSSCWFLSAEHTRYIKCQWVRLQPGTGSARKRERVRERGRERENRENNSNIIIWHNMPRRVSVLVLASVCVCGVVCVRCVLSTNACRVYVKIYDEPRIE